MEFEDALRTYLFRHKTNMFTTGYFDFSCWILDTR